MSEEREGRKMKGEKHCCLNFSELILCPNIYEYTYNVTYTVVYIYIYI